jgi:hypothetical protein
MAHPDEMPRATTVPVAASPDGTREQAGDRTMLAVRAFGWLAFAVAAVAFPALGNGYLLYLATLVAINVIGSIGLNITVGYAGVLSLVILPSWALGHTRLRYWRSIWAPH